MSSGTGVYDPSVGDYADTSPASLGRRMREVRPSHVLAGFDERHQLTVEPLRMLGER